MKQNNAVFSLKYFRRGLFVQCKQWKHHSNPSRHLPKLTIETLEQGVKYVQS